MSTISSNSASFNALKKGTWKNGDFIEFVINILTRKYYEDMKGGKLELFLTIELYTDQVPQLISKKMRIYFIPSY